MAKSFNITPQHVQAIMTGERHYPPRTPKRWDLIAEYVTSRTHNVSTTTTITIWKPGRQGPIEFIASPHYTKAVYNIVQTQHPEYSKDDAALHHEIINSNPQQNGHKPLVLIHPLCACQRCHKPITIITKPAFPLVYTCDGTTVAASYHGKCTACKMTYYHSYYDAKCGEKCERFYYRGVDNTKYLQISSVTIFTVSLLRQFENQIVIGALSFETCAQIFNANHQTKNNALLTQLTSFGRSKDNSVWDLQIALLSYWLVQHIDKEGCLNNTPFPYDDLACRRDIEEVASEVMDAISTQPSKWMSHHCNSAGCSERVVLLDGNEKLRRPMCAAPKKAIKLSPNMTKVIQCCPLSPGAAYISNCPRLSPSTEAAVKTSDPNPHVIVTINLKELTCKHRVESASTDNLPDNDDSSVHVSCKKKGNVTRFYNRTAGILAMMRPCGVIVDVQEIFTCESPSQVFAWLLRLCCDNLEQVKFIGYDRACELKPFLQNLSNKGNVGAQLLVDNIDFFVDLYHIYGHRKAACWPLENNPLCQYDPRLPKFAQLHGMNTEVAEQTWVWLNRFKHTVRKMTRSTFRFFLWTVWNKRNEFTIIQQEKRGQQPQF